MQSLTLVHKQAPAGLPVHQPSPQLTLCRAGARELQQAINVDPVYVNLPSVGGVHLPSVGEVNVNVPNVPIVNVHVPEVTLPAVEVKLPSTAGVPAQDVVLTACATSCDVSTQARKHFP